MYNSSVCWIAHFLHRNFSRPYCKTRENRESLTHSPFHGIQCDSRVPSKFLVCLEHFQSIFSSTLTFTRQWIISISFDSEWVIIYSESSPQHIYWLSQTSRDLEKRPLLVTYITKPNHRRNQLLPAQGKSWSRPTVITGVMIHCQTEHLHHLVPYWHCHSDLGSKFPWWEEQIFHPV